MDIFSNSSLEVIRLIGLISLVIGFFICFFGFRIYRLIIALIGLIIGAIIGYFLGAEAGAVLGGLIGALLMYALYKLGIFLIGMILGALTGGILSVLSGSIAPEPSLLIIFAIIGGVVVLFIEKAIVIIFTAFFGALRITDGLLMLFQPDRFAGNYLNLGFNPEFAYLMMLGIFVFFILGILYQYGVIGNFLKPLEPGVGSGASAAPKPPPPPPVSDVSPSGVGPAYSEKPASGFNRDTVSPPPPPPPASDVSPSGVGPAYSEKPASGFNRVTVSPPPPPPPVSDVSPPAVRPASPEKPTSGFNKGTDSPPPPPVSDVSPAGVKPASPKSPLSDSNKTSPPSKPESYSSDIRIKKIPGKPKNKTASSEAPDAEGDISENKNRQSNRPLKPKSYPETTSTQMNEVVFPVSLLQLNGTEKNSRYSIKGKRFPGYYRAVIGRPAGIPPEERPYHVPILDPEIFVSRRHAQIILKDQEVWIGKIATDNSLKINGIELNGDAKTRIRRGDVIELNYIKLQVV